MDSVNKVISPGELTVGMFVTVLENKPLQDEHITPTGEVVATRITNTSGQGDALKILAIDLPYLVVRCEAANDMFSSVQKMDTRVSVLMELKPEYVKALIPRLSRVHSLRERKANR